MRRDNRETIFHTSFLRRSWRALVMPFAFVVLLAYDPALAGIAIIMLALTFNRG